MDHRHRRRDLASEREQAEWLINYFRRHLAANPLDVDLRLKFGLFLLEIGRTADALAELREVLRLQPNHLRAREALAQAEAQHPRS
ncbi:MAG: hypothetical protein AB1451_02145 [Nitrospirota bacterium]